MLKFIKITRTIIVGIVLVLVFFWAVIATPTSDATDSDITESDRSTTSETITEHTMQSEPDTQPEDKLSNSLDSFDPSTIPAYSGNASCIINNNIPYFTDAELTTDTFENYSDLDSLGRCQAAYANISPGTLPTQERGTIGDVRPSGWHTVKYNGIIDGNYLYNRCHLIAYQLAGENANVKNLLTGTRYMNTEGMMPYENLVADYVKQTGNHVLYRVTPVFEGDNLVANGILLEAKSVEDNGTGIMFHVYCYNVQPGIEIDYATGESRPDGTTTPTDDVPATEKTTPEPPSASHGAFAVNSRNGKIHKTGQCPATGTGNDAMKAPVYFDTYDDALSYSQSIAPDQNKRDCGNCK